MLKKVLRARPYRVLISTGIWVGAFCMMPSCSDDYEWAQEKPSWLGQSIYDELAPVSYTHLTLPTKRIV